MIAIDTNLLVYAHRPESPAHDAAREVLAELAGGGGAWAIPFHCLIEFSGVVTHPRVWRQPSSAKQVGAQLDAWLSAPTVRVLTEDAAMLPGFVTAMGGAKVGGGAVHDARIAACCRFHGVKELWSADRDYLRYPWLKVRNPLVG